MTSFDDVQHTYADDKPTGTDAYTVLVTVTDKDTSVDSASVDLIVNNIDPVVTIIDNGSDEMTIRLSSKVADSGADTFTYSWAVVGATIPPTTPTDQPTISLPMPDDRLAEVSLTVTDDDGGTDSAAVVFVGGTDQADTITIEPTVDTDDDPDNVTVTIITDGETSTGDFDPGDRIVIEAGNSNDTITIDPDIDTAVDVDGGDGNDTITTGSGNDTLSAGGGDDSLTGGEGNDTYRFTTFSDKVVVEDGGIDTLDFSAVSATTAPDGITLDLSVTNTEQNVTGDTVEPDNLTLIGTFENVIGSSQDDTLDGNSEDNLLFGGDGLDSLDGSGGEDTIDGGGGNDIIFGGDDSDSIGGGDGNDQIFGGDGDDTIDGGSGSTNDTLSGGGGNDVVFGGSGADSIDGGDGNDQIFGGDGGNETITGGDGNDVIYGGDGTSVILGDSTVAGDTGDDVIFGGSNSDSIDGGEGNDQIFGGSGTGETITGGDGNDVIFGGVGTQTIYGDHSTGETTLDGDDQIFGGDDGSQTIVGGGGNDIIFGGDDTDSIDGGSGNDQIFGGSSGTDTISGGDGNDIIFGGTDTDTIDGGAGNDQIFGGISANETIFGGSGNDTIDGGAGNDQIFAGDGDDSIDGGSGNDQIFGGTGSGETLNGGSGNDQIFGGSGSDSIDGGTGNDQIFAQDMVGGVIFGGEGDDQINDETNNGGGTLLGGGGNDIIYGGDDTDSIDGGSGNDQIFGGSDPDETITGGGGNDIIFGGSGTDSIDGGSGNDQIFGGSGPGETISGGGGNDQIFGGSGSDSIDGGDGNDQIFAEDMVGGVIFGGEGDDQINDETNNGGGTLLGGGGNDIIYGGDDTDSIDGGTGNDQIFGGSGTGETISGGEGNDQIFGGSGSDSIDGGDGNDQIFAADMVGGFIFGGEGDDQINDETSNGGGTLVGGGGNDIIYGGTDTDSIDGGAGNDQIFGGSGGSETIEGGEGNDIIFGGNGGDSIEGGEGNDQIFGGSGGGETLSGGDGNDVIFNDGGADQILGGPGSDTVTASASGESIFGGTTTSSDPSDVDWIVHEADADMTLTDSTLTVSGAGTASLTDIDRASLTGGPGDNLLDASTFTGDVNLVGGAGNDTLLGGSGDDTLNGGAGNDSLVGGEGADTYIFDEEADGSDTIVENPENSGDTLDFSGATDGVEVDISDTSPQTVIPGKLDVTISDATGIENIFGSPFDDELTGNDSDNEIHGSGGADSLLGGGGDDLLLAGATLIVYLDFISSFDSDEGDHDYSPTERDAIQARMENDFAPFDVEISQSIPVAGPFITVLFNEPRIVNGEPRSGGASPRVGFRRLEASGTVTVDVNAFLGDSTNQLPGTSENFIALSSTIASHEVGHALGVRHHDSFGAPGFGVFGVPESGVDDRQLANRFLPAYPGSAEATETADHLSASPASVRTSLVDALGNPFFGERAALKLAFGESGIVVTEQPDALKTGQITIGTETFPVHSLGQLPSLAVPNTLESGENVDDGDNLAAAAIAVVGSIELTGLPGLERSESDFYSFEADAGDVVTIEVLSSSLRHRLDNTIDSLLRVYDAATGAKVDYFGATNLGAFNDDSFESTDSILLDLLLVTAGSYVVEVDTFQFFSPEFGDPLYLEDFDATEFCAEDPDNVGCTDQDTGDYELFISKFANTPIPAAGDTIAGGAGSDTLIGTSGNETFFTDQDDTIADPAGEQTVAGNSPPSLDPIPGQQADEGGLIEFTANGSDPDPGTTLTYRLDPAFPALFPAGATLDPLTGEFSWTPAEDGTYAARVIVTDNLGVSAKQDVVLTVDNVAPELTVVDVTLNPGQVLEFSASFTDPGADTWIADIDYGDGLGLQPVAINAKTIDLDHAYTTTGPFTVTLTVKDDDGAADSESFTVTFAPNTAPDPVTIDPSVGELVFAVGSVQTFAGSFLDADTLDTHTAEWYFEHVVSSSTVSETRPGTVIQSAGGGTVSDDFSFTDAGVYTATLTVTDNNGNETTSAEEIFVVYDPSEGFVTGGGWINSPAGAYPGRPGADRQGQLRLRLEVPTGREHPHRHHRVPFQGCRFQLPQYQLRLAGDRGCACPVQRRRHGQRRGQLRVHTDRNRRCIAGGGRRRQVPHQDLGQGCRRPDRVRQPAW